MNYRQAEYFLAVCEHKSFSRAAEALFVSEQALSKGIKNLEQEFGVKLFERKTKSIELTEYGLAFLDEAGAYLVQHNRIVDRFRNIREEPKSRLSLAITTGLMTAWLPEDFLLNFISGHPDTDFELSFFAEDRFNRSRSFVGHDLIISSSELFDDDWEVLFHTNRKMRLLMSKNNPLAEYESIKLKDLVSSRIALSTEDTIAQSQIKALFRQYGIHPAMTFGPAEIPLLDKLIEGFGYVSLFAGEDKAISPDMTTKVISDYDASWDLYILKNRRAAMTAAAVQLVKAIRKELL